MDTHEKIELEMHRTVIQKLLLLPDYSDRPFDQILETSLPDASRLRLPAGRRGKQRISLTPR